MERDTQRRAQRAHDHTEPDIVEGESDSEGTEYSFEKRFEAFMMADVAFGPYYWETGDTVPWWRKVSFDRIDNGGRNSFGVLGFALDNLDLREDASWSVLPLNAL